MHQDITLENAWELISGETKNLGSENLSIENALGRTLASDIMAPISQPPFDRSPLDGYALRAADLAGASKSRPAKLSVAYTTYAGDPEGAELIPGQAVRVMTGAILPSGCDCVVRQESTNLGHPVVEVYQSLDAFDNYVRKGEDYLEGELLMPAGTLLNAAALGVLSGAGITTDITVLRRARVAVLSTGDEIVDSGVSPLPSGKIYSSNARFISARLTELGFPLGASEHAADDAAVVANAISRLLQTHDAVITTGGVSVGDKDIMHDVFPILNSERIFWGLDFKPGSPAMFSLCNGKPILSLSGNPFAAAATFELLGRPLLAALSSEAHIMPKRISGVLTTPFEKESKGRRFIRGSFENGSVTLPDSHSSGVLSSMITCNCLVDIPAGSAALKSGETVSLLLL